jgi:hypothetical protein
VKRGELAQLRRDVYQESLTTDSLAQHLEYRLVAIEAVIATPWPMRIVVRARLGRQLRRAARHVQGDTFTDRLTEAAGLDWLAVNPSQPVNVL